MSLNKLMRYILECDGCGKLREIEGSAMEVRASAYNDGWRFPGRVGVKGKISASRTDDVCPDCQPGWKPRPAAAL